MVPERVGAQQGRAERPKTTRTPEQSTGTPARVQTARCTRSERTWLSIAAVGSRDLADFSPLGEHRAHVVEPHPEIAQGSHEIEPGDRDRVVTPVAGLGPFRWRQYTHVGPEPDGARGHA